MSRAIVLGVLLEVHEITGHNGYVCFTLEFCSVAAPHLMNAPVEYWRPQLQLFMSTLRASSFYFFQVHFPYRYPLGTIISWRTTGTRWRSFMVSGNFKRFARVRIL